MNGITKTELRSELNTLLTKLATRYSVVFEADTRAPLGLADEMAGQLLSAPPQAAERVARRVAQDVLDGCDRGSPAFWRTKLGQAIAWHIGHPYEDVSQSLAAAVLGISRQSVHQAIRDGRLVPADAPAPIGHVTSESVRRMLRQRAGVAA